MGKDSREEGRTGSDTAQGPAGPQIEDSAHPSRPPAYMVWRSENPEEDPKLVIVDGQVPDRMVVHVSVDRRYVTTWDLDGTEHHHDRAGRLTPEERTELELLRDFAAVRDFADPPPVELTWPYPGGAPQRYSVTDEGEMDFSYLSLIQRRTMAVRLRTIASALNGDRS